jgi:predicted O-methyltransferase YrrM
MEADMHCRFFQRTAAFFTAVLLSLVGTGAAQELVENPALDARVRGFLEEHSGSWHDMNIPESDGKLLHSLIVRNGYQKALEIGTSTGHSGIWIAWALSKTGGKLITIDYDKGRLEQAVKNFEAAGLSDCIDARLADAHDLVPELDGPFDFVFCDADKDWYKNYFMALENKIVPGGCYTAHNVYGKGRRGAGEFYDYVAGLPGWETTLDLSGGGISISIKKTASGGHGVESDSGRIPRGLPRNERANPNDFFPADQ